MHYEYANSTDLRQLLCEALNLLIDEDRANLSFELPISQKNEFRYLGIGSLTFFLWPLFAFITTKNDVTEIDVFFIDRVHSWSKDPVKHRKIRFDRNRVTKNLVTTREKETFLFFS